MPQQYNQRVFDLVRKYNYNSHMFDEKQTDELQELALQNNIPFKRKVDEFNLRNTISQLSDGFLEGFTTIPVGKLKGNEPKTTYEAIAHSLGHLAGFAPGILAAPLKLGAKGLSKLGQQTASKYLSQGAQLAGKANQWSIPMMGGNIAKRKAQQGLTLSKLEGLEAFKKGSTPRAILEQAVHLGAASAVSSIWKGPDAMMNSGVQGAIAGGAFGGLGEMKMIGNYLKSKNISDFRKGEQRLKGVIGASMLGLPTAMQGEPIEMIIYQTLLGGYFGYGARPAVEAEGGKFIQDLMYDGNKSHIFHPENHPNFDSYSKGAKEYIIKESTDNSKNWLRRYFKLFGRDKDFADMQVEEQVKRELGLHRSERPTQDQINKGYREMSNERYLANADSPIEMYVHKKVSDAIISHQQQMDSNDPVNLNVKTTTNMSEMKSRENINNVMLIVKDPKGDIEVIDGLDINKLGTKGDHYGMVTGDRRVDRPADKLEGTDYITFDGVFIKEHTMRVNKKTNKFEKARDKDGNYIYSVTKYKPLDTVNKQVNFKPELQKQFDKTIRWKTDIKLDSINRYVFGGVKDKGVLTVRKYHDNISKYTKEKLFEALSSGNNEFKYSDISKSYNESLQVFREYYPEVKDPVLLEKMHEKAWKSNVLVEADRNGLEFKDIYKLMKEGYSKNVIDWNKREQIYHDKSMPLPKGTLGQLKFAIFNDPKLEKFKNFKGEEEFYDSDVDGTVYFLEKDMKLMLDRLGLPSNVSMVKPVIIAKIPGYGTMIVKSAGRSAGKEIQSYMDSNGLRAVIMKSASKHSGSIKVGDFDTNMLKKGEYGHIGELETHYLQDTDIRINMGTFENPSGALKPQRIVRQLAGVLNEIQSPGILNSMWNEVYVPNIKGNASKNKLVIDALKNDNIKSLKDVSVDEVSTKIIHEIFINHGHTEIARKFSREMARMDKNGDLEDVDTFTQEEYEQYVYRNNRILDASDFSQSQREAGLHGREFFENNYKKYMLNRYYSPKYKYSAKTWMAPKDPHTLFSNNIKDGEFMLDKGMGKMKVRYKGKDMTLEEAWKKSNGKNTDSAFDFLVIRVPADSISGTRVLKFGGFTKQDGISITTNAKDNVYLGGADKDSDTTFLYQNMPKKIVEGYRKHQKEWETEDGRHIDGKSKELDSIFGVKEDSRYTSQASKFSPSLRRQVADTARKGQQGIGHGIVAKNNLIALADYIHSQGGKMQGIDLIKKSGEVYGTLDIKLKPDAHRILSRLGREIVNRNADASNYSKILDYSKFPDLLFDSAFTSTITLKKYGTTKKANYDNVSKTFLKDIASTTSVVSPKSKLDWTKMSNVLKKSDPSKYSNLASRVGDRMKSDGLSEGLFDIKLVEHYQSILEKANNDHIIKQSSHPIINKLNQILGTFITKNKRTGQTTVNNTTFSKLFNPKTDYLNKLVEKAKISGDWNYVRTLLERDFHSIASWQSLTEKGFDIYKSIASMKNKDNTAKFTEKQLETIITKILEPIAKAATEIKMRLDNKGKVEGELTESSNQVFDREVLDYKNTVLNNLIKKYDSNPDIKGILKSKQLHDYFDLWLLSPFKYRNAILDEKLTSFSKIPFQSKSISTDAIKFLLKKQHDIYDSVSKEAIEISKDPDKEIETIDLFDIDKPPANYDTYSKNVYANDKHFLRTRAITDKQYQKVLEFERTLDNNPNIKDNLKDFYENFTEEVLGVRKDFNIIDIDDVIALDSFIKDMDVRTKSKDTKLPDFAWRASPEYMDLFMRNFENNYFTSSLQPVLKRDKIVMREVKKYTSTIGFLKGFMNETTMKMDSRIGKAIKYNIKRYIHKNLPDKEAEGISIIVNNLRESRLKKSLIGPEDYKLLNEYKELKDTNWEVGDKKYTLDEMIELTDKAYTKDFKQFGDKFLFAMNNGKTKYIDFKKIDKNKEYGRYNDYLIWGKDGRFDMKNFQKRLIKDVEQGKDIPDIPLEVILRGQYEFLLEIAMTNNKSKLSPQQFREKYRSNGFKDSNNKPIQTKFQNIGKFESDSYVPHINFGRNNKTRIEINKYVEAKAKIAYDRAIKSGKSVKEAEQAAEIIKLSSDYRISKSQSQDAGGATAAIESVMHDMSKMDLVSIERAGINNRPQSTLERKEDMPGWDNSHHAIDIYKESTFRSLYKNIAAFQANVKINEFIQKNAFGKNTKDWALYLRTYFRDSMGLPTVFGKDLYKYIEADKNTTKILGKDVEPYLKKLFGDKFKRRGAYLFSDEKVIQAFDYINKKFRDHGRSVPFMKDIPNRPDSKLKTSNPELYKVQYDAYMEGMTRMVHKMGRLEAKFQLWTLLSHTKLMTGNLFGGTSNTITRGGLKNFIRANDKKWIKKNLIKDLNGDYRLKMEDGSIVKTKDHLNQWITEKGIIESFIANELNVNGELNQVKGVAKQNLKDFMKDISKKIKRDPNISDQTLIDIAKKYRVDKLIDTSAAWFMQTSERKLRRDSYLTHAIEYMEHMGKYGLELSLNDPAVNEAGLRGVEATQFLYHSSFRPAYMRTSLGKVLSRFKLFVFNSVRIRKEMIRKASYYGYKQGTKEFDKFKTDFALNMFVMALGSAFAYSLFDTAMPPPYDWVQETGDWLLGDKKSREKAFFGQYPYPIAPLNIITPPVARIPMEFFSGLINKDWERFMDYHAYTMFPFGRMIRSIDKTIDEPYGTLEGRAMQQFFGIPLDKVRSKINRSKILKDRQELIDNELEEMYG